MGKVANAKKSGNVGGVIGRGTTTVPFGTSNTDSRKAVVLQKGCYKAVAEPLPSDVTLKDMMDTLPKDVLFIHGHNYFASSLSFQEEEEISSILIFVLDAFTIEQFTQNLPLTF